jgi:aryl-alcohol dehydrogenase-like predicted oxidoreductase
MAQKPWIVPLFGTRRLERFDENVGSLNVNLTDVDRKELDAAATAIGVVGERYPQAMLARSGL